MLEYDIIARSTGQQVTFKANTSAGAEYIEVNWLAETFYTQSLKNASVLILEMEQVGLSVVLFCEG